MAVLLSYNLRSSILGGGSIKLIERIIRPTHISVLTRCMNTVYFFNRIGKIRQILPCYDDIVIIGILYFSCKIIRFDNSVFLYKEYLDEALRIEER